MITRERDAGSALRRQERRRRSIVLVLVLLALTPAASAHGPLHERIARLDDALRRSPDRADLRLRRADLLRAHGEYDRAVADLRAISSSEPRRRDLQRLWGRICVERGEPLAALRHLDAAVAVDPVDGRAYLLRARARLACGDATGSVADLDLALSLLEHPAPSVALERARACLEVGESRLDDAVAGLDRAIARLGPLVVLQLEALDLERRAGRWHRALARVEDLRRASHRPERYLVLEADIQRRLGDLDGARESYLRALDAIQRLPAARRVTRFTRRLEERARTGLAGLDRPPQARRAETRRAGTPRTPPHESTIPSDGARRP